MIGLAGTTARRVEQDAAACCVRHFHAAAKEKGCCPRVTTPFKYVWRLTAIRLKKVYFTTTFVAFSPQRTT